MTEKTEDYQFKKGVNKALFLEVLEQGVRLWNDKAGRETELGQGILTNTDALLSTWVMPSTIKRTCTKS